VRAPVEPGRGGDLPTAPGLGPDQALLIEMSLIVPVNGPSAITNGSALPTV
jgi:hypothetical protein